MRKSKITTLLLVSALTGAVFISGCSKEQRKEITDAVGITNENDEDDESLKRFTAHVNDETCETGDNIEIEGEKKNSDKKTSKKKDNQEPEQDSADFLGNRSGSTDIKTLKDSDGSQLRGSTVADLNKEGFSLKKYVKIINKNINLFQKNGELKTKKTNKTQYEGKYAFIFCSKDNKVAVAILDSVPLQRVKTADGTGYELSGDETEVAKAIKNCPIEEIEVYDISNALMYFTGKTVEQLIDMNVDIEKNAVHTKEMHEHDIEFEYRSYLLADDKFGYLPLAVYEYALDERAVTVARDIDKKLKKWSNSSEHISLNKVLPKDASVSAGRDITLLF